MSFFVFSDLNWEQIDAWLGALSAIRTITSISVRTHLRWHPRACRRGRLEGRKGGSEVEGVGNTGVVRSIRTSHRSIGAYGTVGWITLKVVACNVGHYFIYIYIHTDREMFCPKLENKLRARYPFFISTQPHNTINRFLFFDFFARVKNVGTRNEISIARCLKETRDVYIF